MTNATIPRLNVVYVVGESYGSRAAIRRDIMAGLHPRRIEFIEVADYLADTEITRRGLNMGTDKRAFTAASVR